MPRLTAVSIRVRQRDWHAAFGSTSLLVLSVESLIDSPAASRAKVYQDGTQIVLRSC